MTEKPPGHRMTKVKLFIFIYLSRFLAGFSMFAKDDGWLIHSQQLLSDVFQYVSICSRDCAVAVSLPQRTKSMMRPSHEE